MFRQNDSAVHSLFFTASSPLSFHERVHVPFLHSFIKSGHGWFPLISSCPLLLNCHHLISNGCIRNLHIIRIIGTAKHGTHTILYLTYFYDLKLQRNNFLERDRNGESISERQYSCSFADHDQSSPFLLLLRSPYAHSGGKMILTSAKRRRNKCYRASTGQQSDKCERSIWA